MRGDDDITKPDPPDPPPDPPEPGRGRSFGRHIRSLRKARGLTQETLAERSSLSPDTIRRLEHGSFSPSLETLIKLCTGLSLQLGTLFESFEVGERNERRELLDLIACESPETIVLITGVVRALLDGLRRS